MADIEGGVTYSANTPVSKPLVLTSIARLLGTNIKDVGRLCTSDKINMWAKYKPWNSYGAGTVEPILFYTPDDLPLRIQKFYGLKRMGSSPYYYWAWDKPLGVDATNKSPYRLQDFVGYKHNAVAPFRCCVKGIFDGANMQSLDSKTLIDVGCIKGFELIDSADTHTDFLVYKNYTSAESNPYEYPPILKAGGQTYSYVVLCINGQYYNLETNDSGGYSKSFTLPLTAREQPYDAVFIMSTDNINYYNIEALLAKNNKFQLKMTQHTVWDNSSISWGSLQVYITERKTNQSYATGQNGGTEIWNYYKITDIKTTCNITFDEKYAKSFYMFLGGTIGYSSTTGTVDASNNPFRILTANDINTYGSIVQALKNKLDGGLRFDSGDSQYYNKSNGTSCSFNKNFAFTDGIYICVKTNAISNINAYISENLDGYSINDKSNSNYFCGEGSSYTKQLDFSKLNSATLNSYLTL